MAIVRSLAIGKAVNSAGPITYQTVKGRTIAREKPVHVANPNTPKQQAQRGRMRNIVEAWRMFYFKLAPYFTTILGYGSAYNEFVRRNIHLSTSPWHYEGDPQPKTGSVVSTGKYGETALTADASGGKLTVGVQDLQLRGDMLPGDQIVGLIYTDDPYSFELHEHELTEADIESLSEGGTIKLFEGTAANWAVWFYSSSRRIASTGVMN